MKRKPGELFYDYCARRLMDQEERKEKLKPRQIWTSNIVVHAKDDGDNPLSFARPLVKLPVRGTFDRSKGHTMPNSEVEKRRQERADKKLKKKTKRFIKGVKDV